MLEGVFPLCMLQSMLVLSVTAHNSLYCLQQVALDGKRCESESMQGSSWLSGLTAGITDGGGSFRRDLQIMGYRIEVPCVTMRSGPRNDQG